jgi:hypothetical protein
MGGRMGPPAAYMRFSLWNSELRRSADRLELGPARPTSKGEADGFRFGILIPI